MRTIGEADTLARQRLMRYIILYCTVALLLGCGNDRKPRERTSPSGKYYGGVFNANESEPIRSLFPLSLVQASAHRIGAQIFEGLVRFDPKDLSIKPALAESWEADATGTVYTFTLRQGARFHDDACFPGGKGRQLTAEDVVACYVRLCTNQEWNKMFWLFQDRISGANAHYQASAAGPVDGGVKGITAPDKHTVRFVLTHPMPGFLNILAHQGCWVFAPEALNHYGKEVLWHPVGTGAFRVKAYEQGVMLVLERNPEYDGRDADGAQLPYLDAIRYTFVEDKNKELDSFLEGKLSVVYELPINRTNEMGQGAHVLQTIPALSIQFLGMNTRKAPLNDIRIRRAIDLAIDREMLVDSVLDGLAVIAERGVVPPGLQAYPYERLPLRRHDPAAGRRLLEEAGYPGGKGLPQVVLQVNNSGYGYVKVAEAVQAMLERHLGVAAVVSVLPEEQHFRQIEMGLAQFWREGWIADHPDPENFLSLFYGRNAPADTSEPSYLNSTRHRDPRFDSLFSQAVRTADDRLRLTLLASAEEVLMENAFVIPLYHERSVRLLQPWIEDMPINGMEYRDMRLVWIDPASKP
ncbi:MAG: ABC transporter substrate-binding protein [Flavobacteriales bacterium]|nr:ABC transporter substrate-binding protein [Flavobacteriales bacterium]